eukprot:TRINITY_DN3171_c0_g1_i11.p1 TRINITY_DN3171_c0_g1~~TRINITY_DN3171_c0_g1_i11.p1  ORF type:complete len:364 (-),score=78.89 TRINITY_DN3171_c0_g1_i11:588-1679(-)
MARDDAWHQGFKREEKLREKEHFRSQRAAAVKVTTYKWVALASVSLALAAGAMTYIHAELGSAFAPYDQILLIVAVLQIAIFFCTLCCTFWSVTREACSQFYFAMGVLAFAMVNLMFGTCGLLVLYLNSNTPYALDSTDEYDDHHMRASYVVAAFVAMVLLFVAGIWGLRLFSLSQENYYEDKARQFQCCFELGGTPDQDDDGVSGADGVALLHQSGEEETMPQVQETRGNTLSTTSILSLQQHQRVINGDDEIHFWQLSELHLLFGVSAEAMEQSTMMCAEKSKGIPKLDAEGKLVSTYKPVLLLPRAWLRSEVWVQHLWATALALAFIESEIPTGPLDDPAPARTFRDLVLMRHPSQQTEV